MGTLEAGDGASYVSAGDAGYRFTIMSVAKPFVFALVSQALVPEKACRRPG